MENTNLPNNLPVKKNPGKLKEIIIFTIILLALVAIMWIAYEAVMTEPEESVILPSAGQEDDGFPDVFYSYIGVIKNIEEGKILVSAPSLGNYLKKDVDLTVLVNNETSFVKLIIPKSIPGIKAGESGRFYEREEIALASLETGDKITAIAYENVKGKTEFTAKKVEVHNR